MQTISLKVEEAFFPHFRALIESLIKDKKVEIIEDTINISSIEEVRKRVLASEQRIEKGEFVSQENYTTQMKDFFESELGIARR